MLAGRPVAFFAVHIWGEANNFLVDDRAGRNVTVHTLVHHKIDMSLPKYLAESLWRTVRLAGCGAKPTAVEPRGAMLDANGPFLVIRHQ